MLSQSNFTINASPEFHSQAMAPSTTQLLARISSGSVSYGLKHRLLNLKVPEQHQHTRIRSKRDSSHCSQAILQRSSGVGLIEDDQERIARIRKMFGKVELSISAYDTAWVAMVPSRSSELKQPCFPQCLDWILQNQQPNGSWGLHPTHPSLVQDTLSSTLACLLALQKWNVGKQLVNQGLDFIKSNIWAIKDKNQFSPVGFDVLFPCMIGFATEMDLNLPLDTNLMNEMLKIRDLKIARTSINGIKDTSLAYFAEGLGQSHIWKELLTAHQMDNGSLLNSPSATASALINSNDDKCLDYLFSLFKIYKNAVPTTYPLDVYTRLCMVDHVEKLGISRYFRHEIKSALNEIYRLWLRRDEEIVRDVECQAMAFRILRLNCFEISSEALREFEEQDHYFRSVSPQFRGVNTIFELYRASLITISQQEPILEKLNGWTTSFLKQHVLNQTIQGKRLHSEVEYALQYPNSHIERLESRKNIELCRIENHRILKTCYTSHNFDNNDSYELSMKDFNACQEIHQEELKFLERWMNEKRLDQNFPRHHLRSYYFAAASAFFDPKLSHARISFALNSLLATVVDDFFDCGGSREELLNLIELVEQWDNHAAIGYCSVNVETIFSALYCLIEDLAAVAFQIQGRSVKHHFIDLWATFMKSQIKEYEWSSEHKKTMPTIDEYIENGIPSIGLGVVLVTSVFFVGPKLSEDVVKGEEFNSLFIHMSLIGRLLNDLRTVKREMAQGKLNSVPLHVIHSDGKLSEEEAKTIIRGMIEKSKRELLRMVTDIKNSNVPKEIKDLFWSASVSCYYFYKNEDEFSFPKELLDGVDAVIQKKIELPSH